MVSDSFTGAGGDALWPAEITGFVDATPGHRFRSADYTSQVPKVLHPNFIALDVTDPEDWHPEYEGSLHAPDSNSGYDANRTVEFDDSYDLGKEF